jgi:hypothetical protein
MKYFLVLVCTYISVLFVFSSCDKRTYGNTDDDYCLDDDNAFEDMKAWYYFNEGTYWIYEEQNSGLKDTVIVYSNQENQFDTIFQFEWHSTSSLGNHFHQWVNTSWSGHCAQRISCNCHVVFKARSQNGKFVGEDRPFMFPHFENNWVSNLWVGGLSTVVSINESLELGDLVFNNVIGYDTEIDATEDNNQVFYKFAKNVGMIEKKIPALNEEWRLIEYQINQ